MALLNELVRPVEEGHGQAVGIVGEPGIGKSRLVAEFHNRLGDAMMLLLEGVYSSGQLFGEGGPSRVVIDAADAVIDRFLDR